MPTNRIFPPPPQSQARDSGVPDVESADSSEPDKPLQGAWNALMAAHIVAFTAVGLFCTCSQRYLFADGAPFFLERLQTQVVTDWFPTRHFSHLLTQFPCIFLIRSLGCHNAPLLGFTYGATQFLSPVAGLLFVWWAARKAPGCYLAFPMLSHSILFLTTSFVMFCEIHPALWLFWCILYLLMFSDRLTVTRSLFLLVFGVLSTRVYESYLFLAWPLVLVAVRRARAATVGQRYGELVVCSASIVLSLTSCAVALYSTLFPFDAANRSNFAKSMYTFHSSEQMRAMGAANRSNFAKSMYEHFVYLPVIFSVLVIVGLLWCVFLSKRLYGWRVLWLLAVACGSIVAVAPVIRICDDWSLQYASRVQALYVPLLFGGLVAINPAALRNLTAIRSQNQIRVWRLATLTCAVSILFQLAATLRWNEYRTALLEDLSARRGVIAFNQSVAPNYKFNWGWTMPSLSVALAALNSDAISTIICDPDSDSSGWHQIDFDPRKPEQIPDLASFGIQTDLGHD